MEISLESSSLGETRTIAEKIAANCRGGEAIELVSDLGGGKTAFVRGLAKGIGSHDRVSSPTFTLCNIYRGSKLSLHHYDFYRLQDAGIMSHEIKDVSGEPDKIIAVEWAEVVQDVLPKKRLSIELEVSGENSRLIRITYPKSLSYLVEGAA